LRELVFTLSYAALDLAQHLSFTNDMLAEEFRPNAYKQAESMAYAIVGLDSATTNSIVIFDAMGLQFRREDNGCD